MLESREDPRDQRTHVDVGHAGEHAPSPSWAEFRLAAHCRDTRTPHAVLRPRRPRALRAPPRARAVTPGGGLRRLLGTREHRSDGAVTAGATVSHRPSAAAGDVSDLTGDGPVPSRPVRPGSIGPETAREPLRAHPARTKPRVAARSPHPTPDAGGPGRVPRSGPAAGDPHGAAAHAAASDRPTPGHPAGAAGRGRRRADPVGSAGGTGTTTRVEQGATTGPPGADRMREPMGPRARSGRVPDTS